MVGVLAISLLLYETRCSGRSLGDGLLQQGAGGDANAVGSRNVDGLTGARVAAGASSVCPTRSAEKETGEFRPSPDFCLDERLLESVDGSFGLSPVRLDF